MTKTERNKMRKAEKRKDMVKVTITRWNPLVQRPTLIQVWVKQSAITNY